MKCCTPKKPACCGIGYKSIPAALGDDTGPFKPENGAYHNMLIRYEENGALYLYTNDGIFTQLDGERFFLMIEKWEHDTSEELEAEIDQRFSDLNVQSEIDHKLNEMVADGTLAEIIDAYLQTNVLWTFDTVADMKAATNLTTDSYAQTLGFRDINDGGGATYYITSTGTADEMAVIAVGGLYANLVVGDEVNVKQLGAYGDNSHDDSNAIIKALTYANPVYLPTGRYKLTQAITITNKIVHGAGQFKTFIRAYNDISGNVVTIGSDHVKLQDLTLESPDFDYSAVGTTNANTGIYVNRHHLTMQNVRVVGFNYGIHCYRAWCVSFYDTMTLCCNYGIYGIDEFNNNLFERCIIDNNVVGFYLQGGYGNLFNACDFEKNTDAVETAARGDLTFNGCYFENNTSSCVHVRWGLTPLTALTINASTFWANAGCDALIKYHAKVDTPIVLRDCTFRNNDTLPAESIPIFVKEHSTTCLPHIIGGDIGASFSVLDDIWVDKLGATKLTATDWVTLSSGVTVGDFAVYEDNKHIFGTVTFIVDTGVPSAATTLATPKTKYRPLTNANCFGALSSSQWQQTLDDLCYVYISSTAITCSNGDGSSKYLKVYIDYMRK